jgi:acyl-CoA reductase-like NAD-dependent aldehyde dehydrogenase
MSTTTLPEQLSDQAREFAGRSHELLIDGERSAAADGRTFETLDPSTGRPITSIAQAGAEDVDRAVKAARRAFEEGDWSKASAADRSRLMNRFADLIEQHAAELAELESLDNGKPLKMARIVDVNSSIAQAGPSAFTATPSRYDSPTCTATRARNPWACAARSSRGTSRC